MEAGGIEPPLQIALNKNSEKSCDNCTECRAARALHSGSTGSQFLASIDADLQAVMDGWNQLSGVVRTAVAALIRANIPNLPDAEKSARQQNEKRRELAMQIARDCRYIIQGCLREEEWQDADQEFCDAIVQRLWQQECTS